MCSDEQKTVTVKDIKNELNEVEVGIADCEEKISRAGNRRALYLAQQEELKLALVKAILHENKLSWCTECCELFPEADLSLVYTREKLKNNECCGVVAMEIGEVTVWECLHRLCPECKGEKLEQHGYINFSCQHIKDLRFNQAFVAKPLSGQEGYEVKIFGISVSLNPELQPDTDCNNETLIGRVLFWEEDNLSSKSNDVLKGSEP